uniref:Tetratricopeptide SHNi-TPR domain-containing protein n=1 Tax=Pyxicephalus adspersus TaxID=30357 RepID=A0AAV3A003_PYXAD|nr:TPA: hypothetical protein GDO54_016075 [Pyxicephalus adspersus]
MAEKTVPGPSAKKQETAAPSTSTHQEKEIEDVDNEAKKLLGVGSKHMVMRDFHQAVSVLQEACKLLAKKYGETADQCADAFFSYGVALLELARMENGVLGNALEGMPEEEDDEKEEEDPNIPSASNLDKKQRKKLREQVYDAMAEEEKPEKSDAGEPSTDEKAENDVHMEEDKPSEDKDTKETTNGDATESSSETVEKRTAGEAVTEEKSADESKEVEGASESKAKAAEGAGESKAEEVESKDKEVEGAGESKAEEGESKDKEVEGAGESKAEEGESKDKEAEGAGESKAVEDESKDKEAEGASESKAKAAKGEVKAKETEAADEDMEASEKTEDSSEAPAEKAASSTTPESKDSKPSAEEAETGKPSAEEAETGKPSAEETETTKPSAEETETTKSSAGTKEKPEGLEEEAEPMEAEEGESDSGESEDEENEGTEEKEDEEEVSNLQLAWEMLDLSKVIYMRQQDKDSKLKVAQTCEKLGEVCIESENYSQAVEDFLVCLNIQKENLEEHDRLLAETHYQLALAYHYSSKHDSAICHFTQSTEVIEKKAPADKSEDSTVPVTNCVSDISHLVRKKRKPEEESPVKEAKKSKSEPVENGSGNGDAVVPTNEEVEKAEAENQTPMETVESTA